MEDKLFCVPLLYFCVFLPVVSNNDPVTLPRVLPTIPPTGPPINVPAVPPIAPPIVAPPLLSIPGNNVDSPLSTIPELAKFSIPPFENKLANSPPNW